MSSHGKFESTLFISTPPTRPVHSNYFRYTPDFRANFVHLHKTIIGAVMTVPYKALVTFRPPHHQKSHVNTQSSHIHAITTLPVRRSVTLLNFLPDLSRRAYNIDQRSLGIPIYIYRPATILTMRHARSQ